MHGGQLQGAGFYRGTAAEGNARVPHAAVYPFALLHNSRPGPAHQRGSRAARFPRCTGRPQPPPAHDFPEGAG